MLIFFLCEQLQPENAIPISSWFDQPSDQQLLLMLPWLQVCVYVTSDTAAPPHASLARGAGREGERHVKRCV